MKNIKNYVIALLLLGALAVPTLATFESISANSEEEKQEVLKNIADSLWKDKEVDVQSVEINEKTTITSIVADNAANTCKEQEVKEVVFTIETSLTATAKDDDGNDLPKKELTDFGDKDTGYIVTAQLPADVTIPEVEPGYTRVYYVVRFHDGVAERLDATLEGNVVKFSSDKFSTFIFGYTDYAPSVKPENPSQPQSSHESEQKSVTTYDDGGPFTTDACGNVYDRWGNEVWHAPIC